MAPVLEPHATRANAWQAAALERLEQWALGHPRVLAWSVRRHERAFRRLLPALRARPIHRVAVVGGGLHPRTALVLGRLLPAARLVIFDRSPANLAEAGRRLAAVSTQAIEMIEGDFQLHGAAGFDLVVIPLGFRGDRGALYRSRGVPLMIHDWIWRRRGLASAVVSPFLLKRINLVA